MNKNNIYKIIIILILIMLSAFFSASETAFSSLRVARLQKKVNLGNRKAKMALQLSNQYDRIISTILVGNNIVNIVLATVSTLLFIDLLGDIGATISTIVTTVLLLIFGEITPKMIAREKPEALACSSALFIKFWLIILWPINFLFNLWKKLISKILRLKADNQVTDDELKNIVEEAKETGGITDDAGALIKNAINFNELVANDILIPRVDITFINLTDSYEHIKKVFIETGYSRLPVYEKTIDNVIGIINHKTFFNYMNQDDFILSKYLSKPLFCHETMKINELLKIMQKAQHHIAIVADEFGGTLGIITLEDILEELVGEIWDEQDEVINLFTKLDDNNYLILGNTNIDLFCDLIGIKNTFSSTTVSGWIMEQFNEVPNENDIFKYVDNNLDKQIIIKITKMKRQRILEIHVELDSKNIDE